MMARGKPMMGMKQTKRKEKKKNMRAKGGVPSSQNTAARVSMRLWRGTRNGANEVEAMSITECLKVSRKLAVVCSKI